MIYQWEKVLVFLPEESWGSQTVAAISVWPVFYPLALYAGCAEEAFH